MLKSLTILCFSVLLGTSSFAQTSDSIVLMKTPMGGLQFFQHEQLLRTPEVMGIMRLNPDAYKVMKAGRNLNALSTMLGLVGGFGIGWSVGAYIGGGEPQWIIAGVGAGLIAVGIPIGIKGNKKFKQAVRIYNEGLSAGFREEESVSSLEFRISPGGLGLVWKW